MAPEFFEKPLGFRDVPHPWAAKKRLLEESVQEKFQQYGYIEVITPTLEFYDTVGKASVTNKEKMLKFMDHMGNPLVLRPDQTSPIARMVNSLLKNEDMPLRLFSQSNVFRAQKQEVGRNAELFQMSAELIGCSGPEADAEMIVLAVEAIRELDISPVRMTIGHVGLLDAFFQERIPNEEVVESLKELLVDRNLVGFQQSLELLVRSGEISEKDKNELEALLKPGNTYVEIINILKQTSSIESRKAITHLEEMFAYLEDYGYRFDHDLVLDVSLIGAFQYYTGIYFEAYTTSTGYSLVSGGRYDRLLEQFGRPLPAVGFALKMDVLLEVSNLETQLVKPIRIYYTENERKQAICEARRLREKKIPVVLHRVLSEGDWPSEDSLSNAVVLLGREKGEE